jgi:hypothetical protein
MNCFTRTASSRESEIAAALLRIIGEHDARLGHLENGHHEYPIPIL